MATFNFEAPNISDEDLKSDKGIKQIRDYLFMMNEQLRYMMNNLSIEENMDEDSKNTFVKVADQIKLTVKKGSVSSEISLEPDQVTISGNRLVINSTQFTLDANGNAYFGGALVTGVSITSPVINGGTINGTKITSTSGSNTAVLDGGQLSCSNGNVSATFGAGTFEVQPLSGGGATVGMYFNPLTSAGGLTIQNGSGTSKTQIGPGSISTGSISATSLTVNGRSVMYSGSSISSTQIDGVYTSSGNYQTSTSGENLALTTWVLNNFTRKSSDSDENLKTDIKEIEENNIRLLDEISWVSFKYKEGIADDTEHYGVIAQEVIEAMSRLGIDLGKQSIVYELDNSMEENEAYDDYTYKSHLAIDYNELLKLTASQYIKMKNRLNSLEERISALERKE